VRVTVLAVGSRGDVESYVALSLGLSAAGHEVRLATHERFRPLVEERGLGFAELEGDRRSLATGEAGQAWLESGADAVELWRRFRPLVEDTWANAASSSWEA
jgi:sterol 3beta-glucosyltransferase